MHRSRTRGRIVWLLSTVIFIVLASAQAFAGAQETVQVTAAAEETAPEGETVPRPSLWNGSAATSAIHLDFNTEPTILPIAEFINLDIPYGDAKWDSSGTGEALSSAIWPGTAVTEGPGLLCDFAGGCPFPIPGYPLSAKASTTNPEASTQDGSATASVTEEGVSTTAGVSQGLSPVLGPLEAVVDVDSYEASTNIFFREGALVSQATSVLKGISIADGTVEINEVRVITESVSNGDDTVENAAKTIITGVSVAGQGAEIGSDGIRLVGGGESDTNEGRAALEAANEALTAMQEEGINVQLLGTSKNTDGGTATASTGGVIVTFRTTLAGPGLPTVPVPGAPIGADPNVVYRDYVGSAILGSAQTKAHATTGGFGSGDLSDLGGLGDLGGTSSGGSSDFGSSDFGSSTSGSSGSGSFPSSSGSSASGSFQSTAPSTSAGDSEQPAPNVAPPAGADDAGTTADSAGDQQVVAAAASERITDGLTAMYLLGALASAVMFGVTRLPSRS